MLIFETNHNIRSKTTYIVPVIFGEPKYSKRKLYSYSIYERKLVHEIRFQDQVVVKYLFNDTDILSKIEKYNSNSDLISSIEVKLNERIDNDFNFEIFPGNTPESLYLKYQKESRKYCLSLSRKFSFLGSYVSGELYGEVLSQISEERYFAKKAGNYCLNNVYVNEYEMKDNFLDNLTKNILLNGWMIDDKEQNILDNYY